MSEIVIHSPGRQNQGVERNRAVVHHERSRREIDSRNLAKHDQSVGLSAQDRADRLSDIGRREGRGCDLIEQRLKQMVVVAVDDQQIDRRTAQGAGGEQSAKSATYNDDPRPWRYLHCLPRTMSGGEIMRRQAALMLAGNNCGAPVRTPGYRSAAAPHF